MTRYKPARRCLLEYDVVLPSSCGRDEELTLIGKVRARHGEDSGYRLQRAFWDAGFEAESRDGISVPEPVGRVPAFRMWLQRKVAGRRSSELLEDGGAELATRIAEVAHKVHTARVPAEKRHSMADELAILRSCLSEAARARPELGPRIERLLVRCEELGARVRLPVPTGIHRDFYADQVLVDGDRLWLLDLDLYCEGDPALDVGNFLGHVVERTLRTHGSSDALASFGRALEDRFAALAGEEARPAARTYTTLTLARHVYITTRFEDRRAYTEAVLGRCETLLREPVA